jgi:hypothetical protein
LNNVTSLKAKLDANADGERDFRATLASSISELQGAIDLTDGKVKILAARVGDAPKRADDPTATVWETVEELRLESKVASDRLDDYKDESGSNLKVLNTTKLRLNNLGKSYANLSASYLKQVRDIKLKMQRLSATVEATSGTDGLRRGEFDHGRYSFEHNDTSHEDIPKTIRDLTEKVEHLAGLVNSRVGQKSLDHVIEDVRSLQYKVDSGSLGYSTSGHMQTQIDTLKMKLSDSESGTADGAVDLPNHNFATYRDLRYFVEEQSVPSIGAFWDIFSALVCMTPKGHSGLQRANEQYASDRTGTTIFENDLAAAMGHEKPKTLYGSATLKEGFGAIKSHAEWSDAADSVKDLLTIQLENFIEGVKGSLLGKSHGNTLARDLLQKVSFQWTKFCSHIDQFYKELTTVSNFSPKTAFLLIGRSSNAIWTAMRPFRTKISLLPDTKSLDNKAAFIWGVLQCHRVMDEFIGFKFQSHPAFVKEMSLFVLTERVDPSQIATVETAVASLRSVVHEMKTKTNHMEDKYGILKRNYDNLVNDVKMLKQASPGKKKRRTKYGAAAATEDESE